jgi:hypothetical protein
MSNVDGLDAERLSPRGAAAAANRLFEKLGMLAPQWRIESDGRRDARHFCCLLATGSMEKINRTGVARHNQAPRPQAPSSKYRGGLSNGCWFEPRQRDLIADPMHFLSERRRFSLSRRIYFLAPSPSAPRVSAASA